MNQAWWHKPIIPSMLEGEVGELQVQGLPVLQSEFKAT